MDTPTREALISMSVPFYVIVVLSGGPEAVLTKEFIHTKNNWCVMDTPNKEGSCF